VIKKNNTRTKKPATKKNYWNS